VLSGCGSSGRPDLAQVSGTITMDGKPLPDAQVVFSPADGRPSTGATDASGKYSLTYIRDVKGAVLGTHSVRITTVPKSTSDQDGVAPVIDPIPAKYNVNTMLTGEVKSGENTVDFPLESK
jgi:hypothetical protein